jgi:hypothetical protein
MILKLESLVMRASVIPGVDFKKIAQIISESIDENENSRHIYKDLYLYVFDKHLHSNECNDLIDRLCSNSVKLWTLEDTSLVAKKLDIEFTKKPYTNEEFRAAMYLMKYELELPMKESSINIDATTYGRLADHYLSKEGTTRLVHRYFHMITK